MEGTSTSLPTPHAQSPPPPAPQPCFNAITNSTRQIHTILKCVAFSPRAQVQISDEGIRVSVEDSRVMQSHAFLSKSLFTTYTYTPPPTTSSTTQSTDDNSQDDDPTTTFLISLTALLECLQLFGISETTNVNSSSTLRSTYPTSIANSTRNTIFDQQTLRLTSGTCRLIYPSGPDGTSLTIILEEPSSSPTLGTTTLTTCHLTTFLANDANPLMDIPLSRTDLRLKLILKSKFLYDAINELSHTNPARLVIYASSRRPGGSTGGTFVLTGLGEPGSVTPRVTVEFKRGMMETFQVSDFENELEEGGNAAGRRRKGKGRESLMGGKEGMTAAGGGTGWCETYGFGFVKAAVRAMREASMVSVRGDAKGVLSLQFMIENEYGFGGSGSAAGGGGTGGGGRPGMMGGLGNASFIEFRMLPVENFEEDEEGEDGEEEEDGEGGGNSEGMLDDDEL